MQRTAPSHLTRLSFEVSWTWDPHVQSGKRQIRSTVYLLFFTFLLVLVDCSSPEAFVGSSPPLSRLWVSHKSKKKATRRSVRVSPAHSDVLQVCHDDGWS